MPNKYPLKKAEIPQNKNTKLETGLNTMQLFAAGVELMCGYLKRRYLNGTTPTESMMVPSSQNTTVTLPSSLATRYGKFIDYHFVKPKDL
jgi:hypothetical protein